MKTKENATREELINQSKIAKKEYLCHGGYRFYIEIIFDINENEDCIKSTIWYNNEIINIETSFLDKNSRNLMYDRIKNVERNKSSQVELICLNKQACDKLIKELGFEYVKQ